MIVFTITFTAICYIVAFTIFYKWHKYNKYNNPFKNKQL